MCRVRETSINEHFDEWLLALLLMQILGNICEVRNKKKNKNFKYFISVTSGLKSIL